MTGSGAGTEHWATLSPEARTRVAGSGCEHQESDRRWGTGACRWCHLLIPPWYLTEAYARQIYEAIGLGDLADHAVNRLRMGGRDYAWTAYLERDNSREGIDEKVDAIHYAIFDTLRSYRLEEAGLVSPEDAERARAALGRILERAVTDVRDFQIAAAALEH